jgi:hypothetical protein
LHASGTLWSLLHVEVGGLAIGSASTVDLSISRLTELRSAIVNMIERPSQEAKRRYGRRHGDEYAYIFLVHVPCVSAPTSNITRHRPAKGTALGL